MTTRQPVKSGFQTSEFWVTLLASNLLLFSNAMGLNLNEATVGAVAAMVVGYIWSRLKVKENS